MNYFTIHADNNITAYATRKEARETGAPTFGTEEQFADVIGNDNARLLAIWNSLPGVKPVTKFTSRKIATERIWRAIQGLAGPVAAEPTPDPASVPETPFDEPESSTAAEQQPAATEGGEQLASVGAQEPNVAPARRRRPRRPASRRTRPRPRRPPKARMLPGLAPEAR